MESALAMPWTNLGPGLTLVAIALSGSFGLIKAYFNYRVKIIELENQRHHQIEDRRNELEDKRAKTNEDMLSRFQATVKALVEEGETVKNRLTIAEKTIQDLRGDIQAMNQRLTITDDWIAKVNAHFVKKQDDLNGTEVTQLTPDLVRVGTKKP